MDKGSNLIYEKTGEQEMKKSDFIIRAASLEDAPTLLALYTPYVEKTAITFEYDVPSLQEFSKRIETTLKNFPYLVAEWEGEIVGYAYASSFKERAAYQWSVETSIYVQQNKKRMGIGRILYEVLEEILKEQHILNVNACVGVPVAEEDEYLTYDSVRFHERLGYHLAARFSKCGYKFHRWYDMVWLEKHIGEHLCEPYQVLEFDKVKEKFEL